MILVPTSAIYLIGLLLEDKYNVLVLFKNAVTADAWLKKIKQLKHYSPEKLKFAISPRYKYPKVIWKNSVIVYPDFIQDKVITPIKKRRT